MNFKEYLTKMRHYNENFDTKAHNTQRPNAENYVNICDGVLLLGGKSNNKINKMKKRFNDLP